MGQALSSETGQSEAKVHESDSGRHHISSQVGGSVDRSGDATTRDAGAASSHVRSSTSGRGEEDEHGSHKSATDRSSFRRPSLSPLRSPTERNGMEEGAVAGAAWLDSPVAGSSRIRAEKNMLFDRQLPKDDVGAEDDGEELRRPDPLLHTTTRSHLHPDERAELHPKAMEVLQDWSVDQVAEVHERAKRVLSLSHHDVLTYRLSRREFFDLFAEAPHHEDSEQAAVRVGMPLTIFPMMDVDRTQTVPLVWVLLALAFHCHGDLRRRVLLAFHIFDENENGELDREEIQRFLTMATAVLFAVGSVPNRVPRKRITFLVDDVFREADKDDDGVVDAGEFFQWMQQCLYTRNVVQLLDKAAKKERVAKAPRPRPTWHFPQSNLPPQPKAKWSLGFMTNHSFAKPPALAETDSRPVAVRVGEAFLEEIESTEVVVRRHMTEARRRQEHFVSMQETSDRRLKARLLAMRQAEARANASTRRPQTAALKKDRRDRQSRSEDPLKQQSSVRSRSKGGLDQHLRYGHARGGSSMPIPRPESATVSRRWKSFAQPKPTRASASGGQPRRSEPLELPLVPTPARMDMAAIRRSRPARQPQSAARQRQAASTLSLPVAASGHLHHRGGQRALSASRLSTRVRGPADQPVRVGLGASALSTSQLPPSRTSDASATDERQTTARRKRKGKGRRSATTTMHRSTASPDHSPTYGLSSDEEEGHKNARPSKRPISRSGRPIRPKSSGARIARTLPRPDEEPFTRYTTLVGRAVSLYPLP